MTFNAAIAQIRTGHLMVRDAREWDALAMDLTSAYHGKDDELIEQLRPPFVQSWRTVTTYVLRDTFDAAGITVTAPEHPWGIATLTANGSSCEPLLCEVEDTEDGRAEAAVYGGLRLLTFEETMTAYTTCLSRLMQS
ncbi:hypothetical protein PY310_20990 [Pseudarthrobacter sp. H3Y2-7]|uniref:hypothetical protein n=1 Tax=Pseudarthrobacter naphthalenicus TaxID=3031328 RepID=UPI0023B20489|nr:hypothetical protein [Pseudarthrobacter sp. H3Y2-7]MDE8671037.1 hypothetical protein [Pseudarthrobacter sp. H3Y2-7]